MLNNLERRIIELSYQNSLTHISSCLNTVNVLAEIYKTRQPNDPVVLGNAHAALALYVVLESYDLCDAEYMVITQGTHQSRDQSHGIWVSGGSLGQAETIAVGMAIADRNRVVHLVTSDGACAEGCVWEAFHLASKLELQNLKIHVIANGYGGYGKINTGELRIRLDEALDPIPFHWHQVPEIEWPWLRGLAGHYVALTEENYEAMMI